MPSSIRNVAIIAHVDHGKTTLVDKMLKQSGVFRANEVVDDRVMDSNDLERERGITILAKTTSFEYDGVKYNIVDTPGHADFGGEVERVLSMVDGALLLVDSSEGPMPQTKFVLDKALKVGIQPIVVINKIDRPDRRIAEVIDEIFELFVSLEATEEQLDFPVLYAVGREGWASPTMTPTENLQSLFDLMRSHIPAPKVDVQSPFSMLSTLLMYDLYVGRLLIGKVYSGHAKIGNKVQSINLDGKQGEVTKLTKLFGFRGVERIPIETAIAGDIVAVAGFEKASVADTICSMEISKPIHSTPIDPPTMAVTIRVNDSPFSGKEGTKVTSRVLLERLMREVEGNVAITLKVSSTSDSFEIMGRGELQIGVLIESMRREGFELSVSSPRVLLKKDSNNELLEPVEEVLIDIDEGYNGTVIEKMSTRKGQLISIHNSSGGRLRLRFHVPSRCIIGYQSEFRNDTRGTGTMSRVFYEYQKHKGEWCRLRKGVLISGNDGEAIAYALSALEARGVLFVAPGTKVYCGMIIGEHTRENDLVVNPTKCKQLSNVRAAGSDENIQLSPPKLMTLEEMLSYIQGDELIEVTPYSIRLRKKLLCMNDRKKASRSQDYT